MTILTCKPIEDDNSLYHHYQGQTKRQPVYLCLELDTGELSADWDGNIGPSTTHRAYHRVDLTWPIPPLRQAPLQQLMASIAERCQRILDDSTVEFENGNHIGHLGDDAEAAYASIDDDIESTTWEVSDVWEPWAAADYYEPVANTILADLGLSAQSTSEEIQDVADLEVLRSEVPLDLDNVTSYLQQAVEAANEQG